MALRLHQASRLAGAFIRDARPDVVFLTSPHGLELTNDFILYENPVLAGTAHVGGDLGPNASTYPVSLTLNTATDLVKELLGELRAEGANVTGIEGFGQGEPLPISWGEILPLSFLEQNHSIGPKVVVLGVPYRRYDQDFSMVQELTTLGAAIARSFDAKPLRVAWVVSSDLAHTHRSDGPYGFCECAGRFDKAVGRWLRTLDSQSLCHDATVEERAGAKSCGYTGLVMLDGALQALGGSGVWEPTCLSLEAPTYYGMGVGTFERKDSLSVAPLVTAVV